MEDMRTNFEKELSEFIGEINYYFDKRHVTLKDFQKLRGQIRDIKLYLDNKWMGCKNGQHKGDCFKMKHEETIDIKEDSK